MLRKQLKHRGKFQPVYLCKSHFGVSKCWLKLSCISTSLGVQCKDGIILGTEKIVVNKMMLSGTDKRSYSIAPHVGCVSKKEK